MNKIKKDKKLRFKFKKIEFKILLLKSLLREKVLLKKYKLFLQIKLHKLLFQSSKSKINNYCIISYKAKSVNRKFSINRYELKKFNSLGVLTGLEKTG